MNRASGVIPRGCPPLFVFLSLSVLRGGQSKRSLRQRRRKEIVAGSNTDLDSGVDSSTSGFREFAVRETAEIQIPNENG